MGPGDPHLASAAQRLPRSDRLRSRQDYLAVQERGRRVSGKHYLLIALPRQGAASPGRARVGVTVSKKVGGAVVRNRVKRWLRESYRRSSAAAPAGVDIVFVARPQAAEGSYAATLTEVRTLIRRLGKPS